jgi:hypothetical protein
MYDQPIMNVTRIDFSGYGSAYTLELFKWDIYLQQV